jgi:hypothetical protein
MPEPALTHRFNDDLLMAASDRIEAKRAFPVIFPVLDDEELRRLFRTFDDPANRAKRRSLLAGTVAVLLVVIALCGTSAEHLYEKQRYGEWIAICSALLGFAGVAIGLGGVMIRRSKQAWLYQRFVGERLRQFHFQTFVCRVGEIVDGLKEDEKQQRFLAARSQRLSEFNLTFVRHVEAEFNAVLQNEEDAAVWLHPVPGKFSEDDFEGLPADFFAAYRALRIRHQLQYADWKLRYGQGLIGGLSLRSLESFLAVGSLVATIALLITELLIILPLLAGMATGWEVFAHWIAICFAIVALGMRTLQDGLQPKRELERYQRYRVAIQDVLRRFDDAESGAAKLRPQTHYGAARGGWQPV